jgi:hypothetical protein
MSDSTYGRRHGKQTTWTIKNKKIPAISLYSDVTSVVLSGLTDWTIVDCFAGGDK